MKFVISSSTLSAHLNTIGRVIVQKNNIPILDCFHFDIQGSELTITASDNDTTLITRLTLNESDADVKFAVNAKTFQDAIKEIPEQPLEFYLNPDSYEITVVYQNGQFKLMAQDAEGYPMPIQHDDEKIEFLLNAQVLNSSLARCMVAAANDVLRPLLNTVCFDIKDNSLTMVSSNGSHLALTQINMGTVPAEGTFLLNTRPATLLRNMLGKEQADVHMSFGKRGATFTTEDYTLICRLVEGRYPNYRSVIPANNQNTITVNRTALISVLRRILIFANPSAVLVKFRLEASTMNISSQDMDFGKSAEETMFCDYSGMPMRIAFKGTTLLDLLQNIEGEEVIIKLSDPSRAGLILPVEQKEGEMVLMLMMPSIFND